MNDTDRFVVIPDAGDGHPAIIEREPEEVIALLTAERKILRADLTRLADAFERDRREPDKILCHVLTLRRMAA